MMCRNAVQKSHARLLKAIAVELAKLEAAIAAMIKATPHFAERAEIIESVPGLAGTTSAGLIAAMPELGQVSNEAISALLGVAPYDDDSGKRRGERQIKGDAARSAICSTWRAWVLRPGTTRYSRRSIAA